MANENTPWQTYFPPSPSPKPCNSPTAQARPDPVGYLVNHPTGLRGTQGFAYDYVLAQHGLYVQAQGPLISARLLIAPQYIRGLAPVSTKFTLAGGLVPTVLLQRVIQCFRLNPHQETYAAITWNGSSYELTLPAQTGTSTRLTFSTTPNTVAEFHSHPTGPPHFSTTDDQDEQGFKAYGIIADLQTAVPTISFRAGIYGHHAYLHPDNLFTHSPAGQLHVHH